MQGGNQGLLSPIRGASSILHPVSMINRIFYRRIANSDAAAVGSHSPASASALVPTCQVAHFQ
jgi:hypothetical protein